MRKGRYEEERETEKESERERKREQSRQDFSQIYVRVGNILDYLVSFPSANLLIIS